MMSQNLRAAAEALARILPKPLAAPSAVPGLTFYRREAANAEGTYITRPMASFLLQGEKLTVAGGITRFYREGEFLVCCGTFPGHCTVTTPSSGHPFLSVAMELDMALLARFFAALPASRAAGAAPALLSGRMSDEMENAVLRLLRASTDPVRARFLGPLAVEELHFLIAASPEGERLRPFCESNTASNRILRLIEALQSDCGREFDITEEARRIGMSLSVFHRRFKETTGLSPIQFQKRLRLFRAQELMISEGRRVSEAAFAVGYRSPSQFAREYSREFGTSPQRDASEKRRRIAGGEAFTMSA